MNNLDLIILSLSIFYSFVLIHLIDNGMSVKKQFYFLIPPILILTVYKFFISKSSFEFLNYGAITLPIFTMIIYNLCNLISWKINKREFRLKIRGARNQNKDNSNWLDRFLSFVLIFSIISWPEFVLVFLQVC